MARPEPEMELGGPTVEEAPDLRRDGDAKPEMTEARRRFLKVAARTRRYVRRFWRGTLAVFLLMVLAVVLLAQTGRGQELAVGAALDRVRGSMAGELEVQGVRSGTLLTGATLTDVRLEAADGRPFLAADSIVFRYSLLAPIFGGGPIRSATIWGLDLEISRYTDDQPMNITRLLAEGSPDSVRTTADNPFEIGHVAIREGTVRILSPAAPEYDGRTATGPAGEPLRELRFDDLDLDLENAVLAPSSAVTFEGRLASFSSSIGIVEEPLLVREAFGEITIGAQGVRVLDAQFRLPGTLLAGALTVGPETSGDPWTFRSTLDADEWGDLADLRWIDPRIPEGQFRGGADLSAVDDLVVDLRELEIELEASQGVFDGQVTFGEQMVMQGVEVLASPITLDRLEPWLQQDLPFEGWLSGEATFSGTLEDLEAEGRMTLVPTGLTGQPSAADFSGTIHRGENPGATDFEASLSSLNYTVLESVWPELPWGGQGEATISLDGRADSGIRIVAAFEHTSDAGLYSEAGVDGLLWRGADQTGWHTDVEVDLRPLAVGIFDNLAPDLGLQGAVSGPLSLDGPFGDLMIYADLEADTGRVVLDGALDLLDPGADYWLDAYGDSLSLGSLVATVPEGTAWSGHLALQGSGFDPDSMSMEATLLARTSRVGPVRVDTVAAALAVSNGILAADSVLAYVGGVRFVGGGRLGLVPGRFGTARFDFAGPPLVGFRPLLMGVSDTVLVQDGLSELDREFMRLQGIEPDTLPRQADVRLEGAVAGAASISGEIRDLDLGVIVDVLDGRYKQNAVDTVRVAFAASGLPETTGSWQIGASALGIVWGDRRFDRGGFEADMFELGGEGRLEIVRRPGEHYRGVGAFRFDSIGGEVDLNEGSIQVDQDLWALTGPARLQWDSETLTVDSIEIVREDDDPMHLLAHGTLSRVGGSDFRLEVDGLHAEQVMYVAQLEELEVGGHVNLDLTVTGPSDAPTIESRFLVDGPRYATMELSRVEGSMHYADQRLSFLVDGWDGARAAVSSSGEFPIDLGLARIEDRVIDAPLDILIAADSLDAAIALSYLTSLEEVLGSVSGEVWISGTPNAPEPEGTITLADAEWSIEAIGVRHTGVDGELRMRSDRTVDVALTARGTGSSDVTGTVLLEPFRDPALDLRFTFDGFQAVFRSDVEGLISGDFDLVGTYTRPVARGALTVDEGTIYVDELQRAAGVVDLNDPFLFEGVLAVDTTALIGQPLFAGLRNPFFDNLRVDVDLSVPSDTWLRSIDTNIEMNGDLLVRYDRSEADFVLIGELQAVRGSHRVLGRTFDIDGGNVAFIGRPGLNPDLDVQASTRVRRPNDAPLDVAAQVEGTLVQPVVTLTTEEAGLAEEDLVSLLVFGQPSSSLGVSQGQQLGQLQATTAAFQAGVTWVGGQFANQFGSAIARELSLDYLSIQQGGGVQTAGGAYVGDTQLELGRYVGDDVFVVMVLRPFDTGPQEQNNVAGLRVEWALTDDYNVEGFLEDRFLRSGSAVLGASGLLENERIWGVFLFRDWGYNPGSD